MRRRFYSYEEKARCCQGWQAGDLRNDNVHSVRMCGENRLGFPGFLSR